MTRIPLRVAFILVLWFVGVSPASARDTRLALLIGNTQGWKGDPTLRYAIRGDVLPMAAQLRRIGFKVQVLQNPTAQKVRTVLESVRRRVSQAPKVTTFLFYYSGHADQKYFHLGRRGKLPLSYKEFVQFLQKLPVRRRFALFDACFSGEIIRQFGSLKRYRDLVRKGATGLQPVDLSRTIPNQGEERGLQVISSSLQYSWESRRYRASIFTYHLLRGLRGLADRDSDGKISMGELFNFVSDAMLKDIRQKPQLFGVIQRSRSYALAPAYHSRLRIGREVVGALQIRVANFVWQHRKKAKHPLQLSVVHGWGTVHLRRKGRCWKQRIFLPKGGSAKLPSRWKGVHCASGSYVRKGSVLLPELSVVKEKTSPAPRSLDVSGGLWNSPLGGNSPLMGGRLGLQWQFVGVHVELAGNELQFRQSTRQQLWSALRLEVGWRKQWGHWELFAGGHLSLGLLVQDIQTNPRAGLLFRYGILATPTFWLPSQRWGVSLQLEGGAVLGVLGGEWRNLWGWRGSLCLRYRL